MDNCEQKWRNQRRDMWIDVKCNGRIRGEMYG
jgi:hypothetical protein